MEVLQYQGVGQEFQATGEHVTALENIDLTVEEGEFLTVVGPSGCGKSTLLNLTVGLIEPTSGEILYRGRPTRGINTEIGYVAQNDRLFPWRTLLENVEFPLELRGVPPEQRRQRALDLIRRVDLAGFEHHYPAEMSGGMRQRANIIRTLSYDPRVIMMDEPFGPLDAQTRLQLQAMLLELWAQSRKTIIFITHDLGEAISLADRVVVMTARPGRIKSVNPVSIPRPRDIYHIHNQDVFRTLYNKLWDELGEEVRRVGAR